MRRHLIIYAKRPLPGYAKTRLGADVGAEQAAGVYARLLYTYLLDLVHADLGVTVELSVASPADVPFFAVAFPELVVRPQVKGDLGQRMAASFAQAFAAGAKSVVLTGTDIPGLDGRIVRSAFETLETVTVVIGPARDGGYYLIGMRAPGVSLFEGVEWGSERVLAQTESLANVQGLAIARLPEMFDVDTVEDLERWQSTATDREKNGKRSNLKEQSRQQWINVMFVAVIVGVFAATAWYYFSMYDEFNRRNLEAFIGGFGPWAPLAYAAIYVISAPIPFLAPVLSAVGGLLFGIVWGTCLVLIVATGSAFVPFYMARRLGRDWVESKLEGKKLDKIYQQSAGSRGFVFVMLMRLIPVLPWEVQNYVVGLTKVSPLTFIAGTMLGIIPGSFSLVFLGAAATDPTSWQFVAAVALKIVTALIPVVAIYVRSRRSKGG